MSQDESIAKILGSGMQFRQQVEDQQETRRRDQELARQKQKEDLLRRLHDKR